MGVVQLATLLTLAAVGAARADLALADLGPGFIAAAALIVVAADVVAVVFHTVAGRSPCVPPHVDAR